MLVLLNMSHIPTLEPKDFVSYLRNPFTRGSTIFGACKASQ